MALLRLFLPIILAIFLPPFATLAVGSILAIGTTDSPFASDPAVMTVGFMGQEELRNNLGTSIAFRAGLIRIASTEETEVLQKAHPDTYGAGPIWLPVYSGQDFCASDPSSAAILATESYLRPTFLRATEQIAAEILHGLSGSWPDWSYGPAQIRPSTALRITTLVEGRLAKLGATARVDNAGAGMFASLNDPCNAIALVDLSLAVASEAGDGPKEHALRHLGGVPVPTLPGVIEYTDMVDRVTLIIDQSRNTMVALNEARFPSEAEEPGLIGPPQLWIPMPGTDWSEPLPKLCLREMEMEYVHDRAFGSADEDASSDPFTQAILVERNPTRSLWDDETPIGWHEAAQVLFRFGTAANAIGLNIDQLRVAAPGTYPQTEALAESTRCAAILLGDR